MMFSMEEEVSAKRPPVQRSAPSQRTSSLSDDDDDDDHFICSILDDSTKEICHYMKNLVYTRQLSSSLPKNNFMYKVRRHPQQQGDARCNCKCVMKSSAGGLNDIVKYIISLLMFCIDTASDTQFCNLVPYKERLCVQACRHIAVCVLYVYMFIEVKSLLTALSKEQEVP